MAERLIKVAWTYLQSLSCIGVQVLKLGVDLDCPRGFCLKHAPAVLCSINRTSISSIEDLLFICNQPQTMYETETPSASIMPKLL